MTTPTRLPALTVGDLMTADPIVVGAETPLAEAARSLDAHRLSGLPVVDASGALVGVISETDVLRARATSYLWSAWGGLRVRHLMTSPAITAHCGTRIEEAARIMEREHVHRLVIVADDDARLPIGILSTSDVLHAIAARPVPSGDA
jgi:CBS domain-containing protein